jgi:hypothetical protein
VQDIQARLKHKLESEEEMLGEMTGDDEESGVGVMDSAMQVRN